MCCVPNSLLERDPEVVCIVHIADLAFSFSKCSTRLFEW